MQIVRDLAGYTLGRSDLVRRAMSKKKGDVMEQERQNFVYGNPKKRACRAVSQTVFPRKWPTRFIDEMTDFAKYAFNKSHAAAYAVVSYQTAYLKYYYPVEFMAALMTSVIDNSTKVAEYIHGLPSDGDCRFCRQISTTDMRDFPCPAKISAMDCAAIKSIGRPVIDAHGTGAHGRTGVLNP